MSTRLPSFWRLPGPARRLDGFRETLHLDRALAIRAPHAPRDLARALERDLADEGMVRSMLVELDPGADAFAAIAEALDMPGRTPAAVASAADARDCAIVVLASPSAPPTGDLDVLARLATRLRRERGPMIALVGESVRALGARSALENRAAAGPLDGAAYAATLESGRSSFEQRVVASIAIETASWDVELVGRIMALPTEQAVRPDGCVDRWADERFRGWRGTALDWRNGCQDDFGGEAATHPLWLAANDPQGLANRVWRGQAAALLPWIEGRRLAIVAAYARLLKPDLQRSGPDVEMLDWGPIANQLKQVAERRVHDMAFRLCGARNELAHGRPLSWREISACIAATSAWS